MIQSLSNIVEQMKKSSDDTWNCFYQHVSFWNLTLLSASRINWRHDWEDWGWGGKGSDEETPSLFSSRWRWKLQLAARWEEFHFCDQCHCINSVLIYTYKIYLFDRLQSKHVTHKLNVGVVPGTLELTWTINLMHKRYQTATENSRILSINVGYVQSCRLRRCCNIPFLQIQFWISHLYPFSPKIPGSVTADTAAMSPSFSAKWNVLLLPQTIIKIQEHFLYC